MTWNDSDDRTSADFVLFALAFIGVLSAAGGVVINSGALAVLGFLLLLITVLVLGGRGQD